MPIVFAEPPPAATAQLRTYLATHAAFGPDAIDSVEYLKTIRILLGEWTLGPSEHAVLLQILAETEGLTIVGNVTDRLGRPGVALRATTSASPHFEYLVVIDQDSGKIINLEVIYTGGLAEWDVTAPAVVEYVAWK